MGKKGRFKKLWFGDRTYVEYEVDDEITNYFKKRIKETKKQPPSQEGE